MFQVQLTFLGPLSLNCDHCACLMISLHHHLFEEDLVPAWYLLLSHHCIVFFSPLEFFYSVMDGIYNVVKYNTSLKT